MPHIDLIEETFLATDGQAVAAVIRMPWFASALWPDLALNLVEDRGDEGLRWALTGSLVGETEVWLEPFGDGVIAHTYLRVDFAMAPITTRRVVAEQHRRARHAKGVWWALKNDLEAGRRLGEPATSARLAGSPRLADGSGHAQG